MAIELSAGIVALIMHGLLMACGAMSHHRIIDALFRVGLPKRDHAFSFATTGAAATIDHEEITLRSRRTLDDVEKTTPTLTLEVVQRRARVFAAQLFHPQTSLIPFTPILIQILQWMYLTLPALTATSLASSWLCIVYGGPSGVTYILIAVPWTIAIFLAVAICCCCSVPLSGADGEDRRRREQQQQQQHLSGRSVLSEFSAIGAPEEAKKSAGVNIGYQYNNRPSSFNVPLNTHQYETLSERELRLMGGGGGGGGGRVLQFQRDDVHGGEHAEGIQQHTGGRRAFLLSTQVPSHSVTRELQPPAFSRGDLENFQRFHALSSPVMTMMNNPSSFVSNQHSNMLTTSMSYRGNGADREEIDRDDALL